MTVRMTSTRSTVKKPGLVRPGLLCLPSGPPMTSVNLRRNASLRLGTVMRIGASRGFGGPGFGGWLMGFSLVGQAAKARGSAARCRDGWRPAPPVVALGNWAASRSRVVSMFGPVVRVKPRSRSTHLCRNRLASQVSLTVSRTVGFQFVAPAVPAEVPPGNQPVLLEFDHGVADPVGHAQAHLHAELAAQGELCACRCCPHRSGSVDDRVHRRIRQQLEDLVRGGGDESAAGLQVCGGAHQPMPMRCPPPVPAPGRLLRADSAKGVGAPSGLSRTIPVCHSGLTGTTKGKTDEHWNHTGRLRPGNRPGPVARPDAPPRGRHLRQHLGRNRDGLHRRGPFRRRSLARFDLWRPRPPLRPGRGIGTGSRKRPSLHRAPGRESGLAASTTDFPIR